MVGSIRPGPRSRSRSIVAAAGALVASALLSIASCGSHGTQASAASSGAGASALCPAAVRAPGETTESIESGGMTRSFIVHVPPGYTGAAPVPLVIDLHPLTVTAALWKILTDWSAVADQENFVVVWPQGYMNSWNAGRCCDPAMSAKVDDVAFVRAMVGQLEAELCVDPKRIYATGCSNGGGMTYELACDAADLFAAVAPVDFDCVTGPTSSPSCGDCEPARPISECQFRATGDQDVPYDGGPTPVVAGLIFPGAEANFSAWSAIDGCTGKPAPEPDHPACERYSSCGAGTEVALCTVTGGSHCLNYASFGIVPIAWATFSQETLP
jgi:polyhydroxybutyrate depolymerase